MSGVSKIAAERNQRILMELVSKPGNDVCADCKARAPRWASHNLGIFICVNCASIHRKIGTHITKVKSLTMDSWTREQVEVMGSIGNITSNVKYNPDETRHPPPANREESERDSELEKYIRAKYEFKRFIASINGTRNISAPHNTPARVQNRQQSLPPVSLARRASPLPPLPSDRTSILPAAQPALPESNSPARIAVHTKAPLLQQTVHDTAPTSLTPASSPSSALQISSHSTAQLTPGITQAAPQPPSSHPIWNDIMTLSAPPPGTSTAFSMTTSLLPHEQPTMQQTSPGSGPHSFPTSASGMMIGGQLIMGSPFIPQHVNFHGQSVSSMSHFQQANPNLMSMPSTFNQTPAPAQPHNAPTAFGQQQHDFAPSPFPQQFVQSPSPQPIPFFSEQMATQANNPFGATWQQPQGQGFPGQNQYGAGQWGSMY